MPGWLTAKMVADNAEVTGVDETSVPLTSATDAAVWWVEHTARPDLAWAGAGFPVPPDVKLGAMLAFEEFGKTLPQVEASPTLH